MTDQELQNLEKKLAKEYDAAKKDVERKIEKHLSRFEKLDKEYAAKVAAGEMDKKEYLKWRQSNMATGSRWEDLRDTLASDLSHTNEIAMGMINDHTIDCYALNMNYGTYEIENGYHINTSFSLYDHKTVENLMREDPKIIPRARLDIPEDKRWNRQKLTSAITQGVLTGDSIPNIARRLGSVADMNETAALRNARTYTTAAENKGRVDSYLRAQDMGIELEQEWMATLDDRTRDSHRALDGERIPVGDSFQVDGYTIQYPGDPNAFKEDPSSGEITYAPSMIYNCRCTIVAALKGYNYKNDDRFSRLPEGMTYEEWKEGHGSSGSNGVVDGKDISTTWQRRPDKFDFEIEDVINAQGFDGLPRVVSADEFDKAVQAANDGNGFIAQRTYSATDQAMLDAYREQLYNGKWYVDCGTGGAQYGQGMYCAADYTGTLSDGIKAEMEHYKSMYLIDEMQTDPDIKARMLQDALKRSGITDANELKWAEAYAKSDRELASLLMNEISPDRRRELNNILSLAEAPSYTETFTLDPSAKIINYDDIVKMQKREETNVTETYAQFLNENVINNNSLSDKEKSMFFNYFDESALIKVATNDEITRYQNIANELFDQMEYKEFKQARKDAFAKVGIKSVSDVAEMADDKTNAIKEMDIGGYASLKGYDAINAVGHGKSGSYTVILNRTKLIIKGK